MEKLQAVKAEVKKDYGCTFQHALYLKRLKGNDVVPGRVEQVQAMMDSDVKKLHFQSIQDATAAKWLQVYPRYADLCIPNEYYSINLNVRYFMDIPSISSCVNM